VCVFGCVCVCVSGRQIKRSSSWRAFVFGRLAAAGALNIYERRKTQIFIEAVHWAHRKNCYKRPCIIHKVKVTPLRIRNNHTPCCTASSHTQKNKQTRPSMFCMALVGYLTNCHHGRLIILHRSIENISKLLPVEKKVLNGKEKCLEFIV